MGVAVRFARFSSQFFISAAFVTSLLFIIFFWSYFCAKFHFSSKAFSRKNAGDRNCQASSGDIGYWLPFSGLQLGWGYWDFLFSLRSQLSKIKTWTERSFAKKALGTAFVEKVQLSAEIGHLNCEYIVFINWKCFRKYCIFLSCW